MLIKCFEATFFSITRILKNLVRSEKSAYALFCKGILNPPLGKSLYLCQKCVFKKKIIPWFDNILSSTKITWWRNFVKTTIGYSFLHAVELLSKSWKFLLLWLWFPTSLCTFLSTCIVDRLYVKHCKLVSSFAYI